MILEHHRRSLSTFRLNAFKEIANLKAQESTVTAIEKRIKETKATLRTRTDELELKLRLKRVGRDELKAESRELMRQVEDQLAKLDSARKDDKRKMAALNQG